MNIAEAHEDAAIVQRHRCLHVQLIANGIGMLREMRVQPPAFSMRSTAWLLLVHHDGDRGVSLYGRAGVVEDELLLACAAAMNTRGMLMNGEALDALGLDNLEYWDESWRCPVHEGHEGEGRP